MLSTMKSAFGGLACTAGRIALTGSLPNYSKVLSAGLKTYDVPPDYRDVVFPDRPKLTFMLKVPNVVKVKKEAKKLRDIQGPAKEGNTFTTGQYGIVALGGGYLHFGHMEMMRLTINRKIDTKTTFALWRIEAPHKPITRKGLGQRMGGGKGAIDHWVTPVKYGRLIVEIGGRLELEEVEPILQQVAKKLPFPTKVVSKESLAAMWKEQAEMEENNQNPWRFRDIAKGNMLGVRRFLSPKDLQYHGKFTGKFSNPGRV